MSKRFLGNNKTYEGVLKEVGPSTTDENDKTTYRYIEIGGEHISRVEIMSGLNGKLRGAIGEQVKLEVFEFDNTDLGKMIVGVSKGPGSVYASQWDTKGFTSSKKFRNVAIFNTIMSIVFFPFLFAGLFFVPGAINAYNNSVAHRYLEKLMEAQQTFIKANPECVVIQEVLR